MRAWIGSLVAGAVVFLGAASAQAADGVRYACADGAAFTLTVAADGGTATIAIDGLAPEVLQREPGSTESYVSENVSLFSDGSQVSLAYVKGGEQFGTECKAAK
ncbi:hypothetical protein [Pararhodospirillum oryzae]|uniref:C-type lysozyme inhibitor domain-containing protein n=1 Tax=Pararhodospirillum oryzae TaxID=478448 RepID=A0A512HC17_9PROT|nr:hypothetical protein [Pararhodospirillum oryzae]GEO82930.1 hypothetical protein ROR02_30610 [Pararhodospirillum oryzae]